MQKHKYQAYSAATQTVAKTRQIVLLYDGTIRFLQQARAAMRENRIEDRYHLLTRAADIIAGLQTCLDHEQGGHIAKLLHHFYTSIDSRLFALHRSNSIDNCDAIIRELKQMRDAWDEIDQNSSGAKPAAMAELPAPEQSITLSA